MPEGIGVALIGVDYEEAYYNAAIFADPAMEEDVETAFRLGAHLLYTNTSPGRDLWRRDARELPENAENVNVRITQDPALTPQTVIDIYFAALMARHDWNMLLEEQLEGLRRATSSAGEGSEKRAEFRQEWEKHLQRSARLQAFQQQEAIYYDILSRLARHSNKSNADVAQQCVAAFAEVIKGGASP